MNSLKKINILICFDDIKGDYTRHAAVTILSVLETNKKHKIKFYILSSSLSKENINELKRIVDLYDQELEFIIRDDIVSEELKKVIINKREGIRGPRYRRFFPLFIKDVDRILYFDCDVLVVGDIFNIYNMDMHGKAIAGCLDSWPFHCQDKYFHLKNYINSGVLLFDAKKYDVSKINVSEMEKINKKYSKYFHGRDQDKANIIFKDDIYVYDNSMNYQILGKYFNKDIGKAKIIHCFQKPYLIWANVPKEIVRLYYNYLNITKRQGFNKENLVPGLIKNALAMSYQHVYFFIYNFLLRLFGKKFMKKLSYIKWKLSI